MYVQAEVRVERVEQREGEMEVRRRGERRAREERGGRDSSVCGAFDCKSLQCARSSVTAASGARKESWSKQKTSAYPFPLLETIATEKKRTRTTSSSFPSSPSSTCLAPAEVELLPASPSSSPSSTAKELLERLSPSSSSRKPSRLLEEDRPARAAAAEGVAVAGMAALLAGGRVVGIFAGVEAGAELCGRGRRGKGGRGDHG